MRHPEGGYILQTLAGVERMTDVYGREVLVLHFQKDEFTDSAEEPIAVMLTNYSKPGPKPYTQGEDWLIEAMQGDDCELGKIQKEVDAK